MARIGIGIGIGKGRQGTLLNLKLPTNLVSSFNVNTISGVLGWTDTNAGKAEYEVYRSINGGADTLLATTAVGATSYTDTGCKQNASVVYKIKTKIGTKVSNPLSAAALNTPLCWKTDQSVLTTVTLQTLNIEAGKSVTVNWGDGTSQVVSGNNTNITKNYGVTGQYAISISGDVNNIVSFSHVTQSRTYGNVANWILPNSATNIQIHTTSITGDITNWILPNSLSVLYLSVTSITGDITNWILPSGMGLISMHSTFVTGSLPNMLTNENFGMDYRLYNNNISNSNVVTFRKSMTVFNIGNQKVPFTTANIDKVLKALADWYQVNAPTANCTFTLSGANMGIPTGGSSNVDLVRLVNYYTAAGRTATVLVRTS